MPSRTLKTVALVGLLASPMTASAALTVFSDDFSSGSVNSAPSGWSLIEPVSATLTVQNAAPQPGTGNYLRVNTSAIDAAFRGTFYGFGTQSLLNLDTVGERVDVSFNLRVGGTTTNVASGLRVGLFNSAGNGYWMGVGLGPNNTIAWVQDTSSGTGNAMGSGTNAVFTGTGDSRTTANMPSNVLVDDAATYPVSFSIERASATTLALSGTINGATTTATAATTGAGFYSNFSSGFLVVRLGGAGNFGGNRGLKLDDVIVTVPEPSSMMALIGACAWFTMRRRV